MREDPATMPRMRSPLRGRVVGPGLALAAAVVAPWSASAHFVLRAPESWREQGVLGDPQKIGPCGEEGTAAATGAVTAFAPGETITITLDEAIFHPGHYRVALSVNDRSELPAEPPVTPGDTPCGSVPIMDPPVFPVLADGMLPHTEPFPGTQSFQVTLPPDVTCTHCTLQVLEFMSNHAAPCFYHHCADLSITAGDGTCETDAECPGGGVCWPGVCDPVQGCVTRPVGLADVGASIAGIPGVAACADERIPRRVGGLVAKAEKLVTKAAAVVDRATPNPTRLRRLIRRATQRLDRATRKVVKLEGRKVSTACGAALEAVLGEVQTQIDCVIGSPVLGQASPPPASRSTR